MFPVLLWFLVSVFLPPPAAVVAERAGATCERGCIVGADGWVYEVKPRDQVWLARALEVEVGDFLGTQEGDVTAWLFVQGFYLRHLLGDHGTLAGYVMGYSPATRIKWSAPDDDWDPREVERPRHEWKIRWVVIPEHVRVFTDSFLRGDVANQMPGVVYCFTHGWEHRADDSWIGPSYAAPHRGRSYNAYYRDRRTEDWTPWTVRVVGSLVAPTEE